MHTPFKKIQTLGIFKIRLAVYSFMWVCILTSLHVYGQPLDFRHYEVEAGLSNNIVICALQDQHGFMWFGTADGLNRFDGNAFRVFRHADNNPYSIGSNAIRYLFQDHQNRLWIGTGKGLYYYDQKNERFLCVKQTRGKFIRSIQDDAAGRLWYVASGQLYRFTLEGLASSLKVDASHISAENATDETANAKPTICLQPKVETISLPGAAGHHFTALTCTPDGSIWLGTEQGVVWQYPAGKKAFHSFRSSTLKGSSIEKLMSPAAGKLWIGSSKAGLIELNTVTGKFSGPLLLNEQGGAGIFVRDIMLYHPGEYWVASEDGLYRLKVSDSTVQPRKQVPIQKVPGDPYSLSDNSLYTLCKDKEGGVWLGSYFGGINYLPERSINFEKYYPGKESPGFKGNVIREITKDERGDFWIGTEDAGLNRANFKTGKFQNFQPARKGQKPQTNIHGLFTEGALLYIGTFEQGIDVMDLHTRQIIRQYTAGPGPLKLKSNYINAITKTSRGQYYICTARGLYRFFPEKGTFELVSELPKDDFYSAINEDNTGRLWIGTHNHGVYYLDKGRAWRQLHIRLMGKDRLNNVRILFIKDDQAGRCWIATEDGLYRVDQSGQVKIFNDHNGLPGNIVYALVADTLDNMWLSTSMGLARINHATDEVKTFNQADGLLNNQFNNQSVYRDQDGFIYFGSVKGLIRFNPYNWKESTYCPPLFFTGLQVFNQEMPVDSLNSPLKQSMLMTRQLDLTYKQSTFSLDFAALSYHSPSNLEFAYKVEGLDEKWTYIKGHRRIYFTNLKAGNYTLKIKSTNSSGLWVANERILTITILPPFWKSGTAYLFYWLAFALIVGGALYYYGRRQRIKAQRRMQIFKLNKEKELYQSKVDFFTHIAHEIRTPLTLIKGPMDKILSEKEQLPHLEGYIDLMQRNTNRLLDLTHELLDFRKIESSMMVLDLKEIEIGQWLQKQLGSYQLAAQDKGIHFLYIPPMQPTLVKIDEKAVAKMVHNLLNNALKYADAVIMIRVYSLAEPDRFTIQIENDGYLVPEGLHLKIFDPFFRWNRKRQVQGSGIGLSVADSLAKLHGGTLRFSITEEKYNTFKLTLPVDAHQPAPGKKT